MSLSRLTTTVYNNRCKKNRASESAFAIACNIKLPLNLTCCLYSTSTHIHICNTCITIEKKKFQKFLVISTTTIEIFLLTKIFMYPTFFFQTSHSHTFDKLFFFFLFIFNLSSFINFFVS